MMEVKLWTVACVLLLTDGSSAQNVGPAASLNSSSSSVVVVVVTPGTSPAGPLVSSSRAPDAAAAAAMNRSEPSPSPAAGTSSVKVTTTLSPLPSAHPENNHTDLLNPASPEQSPTTQLQPKSTVLGPARTSGEVSETTRGVLPDTSASSVAQPGQGTVTVSHLLTSPWTSALPNTMSAPKTSPAASPSTGSPQGAASPTSTAVTSPQQTHQPDGHPQTSRGTQRATTAATPASVSTQAKTHGNNPSQLNVGGDTTILHQTPTLDPLLAGLVSAFIITAVILTLLLFLKLRGRNSRPEFRRLQDLPMDDMEDTPLSMYSY